MTAIVVDVGCRTQGPEHSTDKLIDRFRPRLYFGFDPDPQQDEGVDSVGPTIHLIFKRAAAWVYDGTIAYEPTGITGTTVERMMDGQQILVPCFDFATWFQALPDVPTVVKFDCEGAEYPIIDKLIARGLDTRIELLLVEWHPVYEEKHPNLPGREELTRSLRCPVEEWR